MEHVLFANAEENLIVQRFSDRLSRQSLIVSLSTDANKPAGLHSTFSVSIWNPEVRERLTGCLATVSGTPLGWTISDRFRIWEIDCPEEGIHIGMDKTISYIKKRIDARISLGILFTPFLFLFCLAIYSRERRGNL